MVRIKDILKEIEQHAPLPLQESFDNAGVQVGDVNQYATGAMLCLMKPSKKSAISSFPIIL